jgi:Tfp pilus assembly protein PilN
MDEAEAVLARLERIRELEQSDAPASALLEELRQLVVEAEDWARVEGDPRARAAAVWLGADVSRLEEVTPRAKIA